MNRRPAGNRTREIAVASVFAALYFVLRIIPVIPMIGIPGRFTAGDFALNAIVLAAGLWGGLVAVFVGSVIAYPLSGTVFLGLDFLPGVINILTAGLILRSRCNIARLVYGVILAVFIVSPYSLTFGYGYVPYTWLHIVGFAFLCSPLVAKIPSWIGTGGSRQVMAFAVLAFIATMAQHLVGGLLYEFTLGVVQHNSIDFFRRSWQFIFWVYPIERILIVAFSTVVSLAVVKSLRRLNFLDGTVSMAQANTAGSNMACLAKTVHFPIQFPRTLK